MNIIDKNTEQKLLEDLRTLWQDSPTSRCVYLRFSQLKMKKEDWFPIVVETLQTYLLDDITAIYVCSDNDLMITSDTLTQKTLDLLLTHLRPKLSPASLQGSAAIFEMKVDWPKLRTLCERKIEDLEILRAKLSQKKKEQVDGVSRAEALKTLDADLLSSLAMRRDLREETVIMVVEDDAFSQKLIKNTVKDTHTLSITGDGQGAIMNYVHKAPDVLFLDIGLPDIDGLSVLKKIFQIDPSAYVVMFSGNGDRDNVLKAVELGARGFLGKPFTKDKLFQYINKSPFIQNKQKLGVA